jgi:opacity protein-like surface antigen
MKIIGNLITTTLCLTLSTTAFANKKDCNKCTNAGDIFLSLEAGASFSTEASMQVTTGNPETLWDSTPQGYNSDLGNSAVWGGGIGYQINKLLAVEIEAAHRDSFEYKKFQTSPGTPLGNKTRYFDLKNTTVMTNLFLNGSGLKGPFSYTNKYYVVDPFVTGGIGWAYNTVDNFHTIEASNHARVSMEKSNSRSAFAYQLGAGINVRTNKNFSVGVGYRFLDAGSFSSNTYIEAEGTTPALDIPAWKGDLRTNEVYLNLNYYL